MLVLDILYLIKSLVNAIAGNYAAPQESKGLETIAISGPVNNLYEKIISWRTEVRDERPSSRTSFFPSFSGHES